MHLPYLLRSNMNWMLDKSQIVAGYAQSYFKSDACKDRIGDLRTFCLFMGYPRSGHSLVGSLLDAHPDCNIANELDVLRFLNAGFSRDQICFLLLRNSEQYSRQGRTQTGYKYDVPNQWQGRVRKLLVLGDKKGGMTTQRLGRAPALLARLEAMFGVPVKLIHVVRNPFDNITTMTFRTGSTVLKEIVHFFDLCQKNTMIVEIAGSGNVLTIRHEDLISDPRETLARMTSFLDLEVDPGYLEDCAGIIYRSPNKSRDKHGWSEWEKNLVLGQISRFPFLSGYTFEN